MTINQLIYFVEVINNKSFSKAAEILYITQPAITLSIQSLEKELGFKLYQKGFNGIICTEKGEAFYQDALRILNMKKKWDSMSQESLGPKLSYVDVAVVNAIYYTLFSSFLLDFNTINPHSVLNVSFGSEMDISAQIHQQKSSIYISSVDSAQEKAPAIDEIAELYDVQYLFGDRRCAYLNRDHPLAGKESIQSEELLHYTGIIYANEKVIKHFLDVDSNKALFLNHQEHIFKAVSQNKGYAIFPEFIRQYYSDQTIMKNIVTIPLQDYVRYSHFFVVYPKQEYISASEKRVVNALVEFFRGYFPTDCIE